MFVVARTYPRHLMLALGLVIGLAVGTLAATQSIRASLDQPSTIPVAWMPPPGVVQISPCVRYMGEHWANPADGSMGPIYNVYKGRLMAIEYAVAHEDFMMGKEWSDLTFRYWDQPLTIVQASFDFQPRGHPGYLAPHYDLHFYLVTHAEAQEITCQ